MTTLVLSQSMKSPVGNGDLSGLSFCVYRALFLPS